VLSEHASGSKLPQGAITNTPPVGATLFISSTIAGSPMSETVKALWPFFWVAILLLLAISYIPALTIRF
jgi:TRAP-type C4-dicarboxylate transport system permease large subunit